MFLDDVLAALTEAGFRSQETRFVTPPKNKPFVVWDVSVTSDGPDDVNTTHACQAVVSVVEHPGDDRAARDALEGFLDSCGIAWTRGMRQWSEDENVYVTDYEFSWSEKIGS